MFDWHMSSPPTHRTEVDAVVVSAAVQGREGVQEEGGRQLRPNDKTVLAAGRSSTGMSAVVPR
jgi:hypothetical protein